VGYYSYTLDAWDRHQPVNDEIDRGATSNRQEMFGPSTG